MDHLIIYALVDPRTRAIRYIGKSRQGLARPAVHTQRGVLVRDPTYKGNWLRELAAAGHMPQIRILEVIETREQLNDAEIRWIAHGRASGWPLTNLTPGGDGVTEHSPEHLARLSARMQGNQQALGTMHTDEWKAANAERMHGNQHAKGFVPDAAWRRKQSERMRGNRLSEGRVVPADELAKRTASIQATYANWTDEQHAEHSKKVSDAKQGSGGNLENLKKGWTPEVRARAVEASAELRRGTKHTHETRAKMSSSQAEAWKSRPRAPAKPVIPIETYRKGDRWSLHFDDCVTCHETTRPHKSNGVCTRCYLTARRVARRVAEAEAREADKLAKAAIPPS